MEYTLQGEKDAYIDKNFTYLIDRLNQYGIFKQQLQLEYNLDDIVVYKMEIDSPHHEDYCHIEVYAKNNSKATGALKVLELLNIDKKDSFFFGDGDNDVEILSEIGLGMAMANGSVKARNAAKIVVPSVFEDGVAYGIEKYILDK